jgi:L-asparaginase II
MPFDDASADALRAAGEEPGRVHNNCSGKHAGMLALARHNGWATEGYHRLEHPVQQRMLSEMSQWCDVRIGDIATGVDGCGVVTFGLPLNGLALMFSRLALASSLGVGAASRAVNAMRAHPMLVAGRKRLCTALMETTAGGVFAKVGAEGVYCAGVPSMGIGVALKVEDGALRAAEPALLAVLTTLGVLGDVENSALSRWSAPSVRNTRREDVGRIESHIELETV